jgi:hypothetical protein
MEDRPGTLASFAFALVSFAFALPGQSVTLVGRAFALVRRALALSMGLTLSRRLILRLDSRLLAFHAPRMHRAGPRCSQQVEVLNTLANKRRAGVSRYIR